MLLVEKSLKEFEPKGDSVNMVALYPTYSPYYVVRLSSLVLNHGKVLFQHIFWGSATTIPWYALLLKIINVHAEIKCP
jgi:hypothetical protein